MVSYMISKGANDWEIGLGGACERGNLELMELMVSHGAKDFNNNLRNASIQTKTFS